MVTIKENTIKAYKSFSTNSQNYYRIMRAELAQDEGWELQSSATAPNTPTVSELEQNGWNDLISYFTEDISDSEESWISLLLEDLIGLFYLLYDSLSGPSINYTKFMFAVTNFLRLRCRKGIRGSLQQIGLVDYAKRIFQEISSLTEIQSAEEYIGSARDLFTKFTAFRNSEIYKRVYKIYLYALSFSLFDKLGLSFTTFGYTIFEHEALQKRYHMGVDFVSTLCDTLIFCCERGYQVLKTGKLELLFHSGKVYTEYFDSVVILKRQSVLLSNPEAHGFTESAFRSDLDDTIEKGHNILSHSSSISKSDIKYLKSLVNDLEYIKNDLCTKRAARAHRIAPFAVLINGESSIGKSTIKDLLFYHYASLKGLDNDPSFCYTRNPVAKYWDGFTTSQWCVVLDDVASIKPTCASQGDPSMSEVIQLCNPTPFGPDQADLADKGRTPMRCKLVIATTNVKDMNCAYYFSHPSAVQRRLPYIITPIVKDQFANPDGSLDSSKVSVNDGEYPDFWIWTVEKVIIRKTTDAQKLAKTESCLVTDDVNVFIKWFNGAVSAFDSNQAVVSESISKLRTIILCDECHIPIKGCVCEKHYDVHDEEKPCPEALASSSTHCKMCFQSIEKCDCEVQSFNQGLECFAIFCDLLMKFLFVILRSSLYNLFDSLMSHFWLYRVWKTFIWYRTSAGFQYTYMKLRFHYMGESIRTNIGHPKILISIAAILATAGFTYKIFSRFNIQGNISDNIGESPTPDLNERNNVWYKDSFKLSSFDLTAQTLSSKSLCANTFCNLIKSNLISFSFPGEPGKVHYGKALCLRGQKYITNNHNIPVFSNTIRFTIICEPVEEGISRNITVYLSESQIVRIPEHDLLIFKIPNLPPRKNIFPYLAKKSIDIKTSGFYLSKSRSGSLSKNDLSCIKLLPKYDIKLPEFTGDIWYSSSAFKAVNGDCGSTLIGETVKGFVVLGLHVLGSRYTNSVGAIALTQELLLPYMEDDIHTIESGVPSLSSETAERSLDVLHSKSVFRFLDGGSASVYGSFSGFRASHKSQVGLTPMSRHLSPLGYKIKFGPPVMKGWEPWRIAASDIVNPVVDIHSGILDECVSSFLDDIFKSLPDMSSVNIYDDFTTINGAAGVSYVDKINRSTSAGNPWKKSKKFFLKQIPPQHGLLDPVEVDDEIMQRVDKIILTYHSGKRAMPNFCAHLKDEPVSFKKIKSGKTRVFAGAPFDWSIVVRKYLLSSVRLIQNNRFVFESAPGTIAQSYEWGGICEYVTKYGSSRMIAGDYKAFDKKMSPVFVLAAFTILKAICKRSGNYSPDDLRVIDGIAQDTAFPLIDFDGDLVEFYGSNPSGHPLTVIINGLANSLMMRYVYYNLNPAHESVTFKSNVALMTYGDDNIMSVSVNCPWYTHTTIAHSFQGMGITYTMPDKEAISVPYVNLTDVSFLKRRFIYDLDVEAYLAPLEHESIEKMLMVWTRSTSITEQEQCIAVISSAIREYFFYGKETFENKRLVLQQVVQDLSLESWSSDSVFPTWSFLVEEFKNTDKERTKVE